jgi:hypothetical protein
MNGFEYAAFIKDCAQDVYRQINIDNKGKPLLPMLHSVWFDWGVSGKRLVDVFIHPDDLTAKNYEDIKHYHRDL